MGDLIACQDGDILVEYEGGVQRSETKIDLHQLSTSWPEHMMVFGRSAAGDNRFILHVGIQRPDVDEKYHRTLSGIRASQQSQIPNNTVLVLRIGDKKLRENFVKVTEEYARRVSDQPVREAKNVKHYEQTNHQYLPTPLFQSAYMSQRKKETAAVGEHIALFRNIRAYMRFNKKDETGAPTPLSKNWGVECSQFISYSYMIASIMTAFPNGLPDEIIKQVTTIDAKRHSSDTNVDDLLNQLYKDFARALGNDSDAKHVLSILCNDVKHIEIDDFCRTNVTGAINNPRRIPLEIMGTLRVSEQNNKSVYQINTVDSAKKLLASEPVQSVTPKDQNKI